MHLSLFLGTQILPECSFLLKHTAIKQMGYIITAK